MVANVTWLTMLISERDSALVMQGAGGYSPYTWANPMSVHAEPSIDEVFWVVQRNSCIVSHK